MQLPLLKPRTIHACQVVGFILFAIAFLLPSCNLPHSHDAGFRGYECAKIAFSLVVDPGDTKPSIFLRICLILSDLLNLSVVLYLIPGPRWRRAVAISMAISAAATWIFFVSFPLVPLIGHFVWVLGALLVVTPEFASR
jgi:hypothetical protein